MNKLKVLRWSLLVFLMSGIGEGKGGNSSSTYPERTPNLSLDESQTTETYSVTVGKIKLTYISADSDGQPAIFGIKNGKIIWENSTFFYCPREKQNYGGFNVLLNGIITLRCTVHALPNDFMVTEIIIPAQGVVSSTEAALLFSNTQFAVFRDIEPRFWGNESRGERFLGFYIEKYDNKGIMVYKKGYGNIDVPVDCGPDDKSLAYDGIKSLIFLNKGNTGEILRFSVDSENCPYSFSINLSNEKYNLQRSK